MGERGHRGEFPHTLDERAGALAVVAAEQRPHMRTLNDYNWLAKTRRVQAISVWLHCDHMFVLLLLNLPFTARIIVCITNWANTSRWSRKM
jgi:hypothetical protein